MIPKVVHRIWFGPHPMRQELIHWGRTWEKFGYDVQHWTERNLPALINQAAYDLIGQRPPNTGIAPHHLGIWTQRADLVSYELIWQYGGIYANCDIEPLRDLHDLVGADEAFCGWETEHTVVCNALFGAVPHHPWIGDCITHAGRRLQDLAHFQTMQQQTGPGCISQALYDHPEVTVYPRQFFYPYGFEEMELEHQPHPDAWTSHHWGHTRG